MCSIMGYCGSSAAYDVFWKDFNGRYPEGRTILGLWIPARGFWDFIGLRLWGLAIRGCSLLS